MSRREKCENDRASEREERGREGERERERATSRSVVTKGSARSVWREKEMGSVRVWRVGEEFLTTRAAQTCLERRSWLAGWQAGWVWGRSVFLLPLRCLALCAVRFLCFFVLVFFCVWLLLPSKLIRILWLVGQFPALVTDTSFSSCLRVSGHEI